MTRWNNVLQAQMNGELAYENAKADWFAENNARAVTAMEKAGVVYNRDAMHKARALCGTAVPHVKVETRPEPEQRQPKILLADRPDIYASVPKQLILSVVARVYGLTLNELVGRCRIRQMGAARSAAAWALKRYRKMSLTSIGHELGGRNHTTVMNAFKRIKNNPKRFDEKLSRIDDEIVSALEGGHA